MEWIIQGHSYPFTNNEWMFKEKPIPKQGLVQNGKLELEFESHEILGP